MKIVFDIGGTNMRFSFVKEGNLGEVIKIKTPQNLELGKKAIADSIKEISNGEKIESIVGGMAGFIENGIIYNSTNLKEWDEFDLGGFLKENFCDNSDVYNDADLAGLGEVIYGAAKDFSIVAYVGVGTGVGGTRIVNKEIDKNNYGFEPGHQIIDFKTGEDLESFISGGSILRKYGKKPEEIGQENLRSLLPTLAVGLYNVSIFWSPEVLVLGGSLLNEDGGFKMEEIEKELDKIKGRYPMPQIKKAELGDSSGLWGALSLS